MAQTLDCLIVRQPYASLIAFGRKRWEFRSYDSKKKGTIGIAASNAEPLRTRNQELNSLLTVLPRGVILAKAELVTSFFVTSKDLSQFLADRQVIMLGGKKIETLGEPLGEPKEDVESAAADPHWQSFAWLLEAVKPLEKKIAFERTSQSTWVSVSL